MTTCQFRLETACQIAGSLYADHTACTDEACTVCLQQAEPRAVNSVTVSLALSGASRAGDHQAAAALIDQYGHYLERMPGTEEDAERLDRILTGRGVGSHLWRALGSLGIKHSSGCDCLAWAERMNAWGPAGCRLARAETVAHMRDSAKHYGWGDLLKAAGHAVTTGIAWRINPLDIYGSLLDESIRRAEAEPSDMPEVPQA